MSTQEGFYSGKPPKGLPFRIWQRFVAMAEELRVMREQAAGK